jgi:stage V sporulation protein D (sporulation-specific penicillin-binding protein)
MDMPFSYEKYVTSRSGNTVVLTLDATVQACLEKQMETAIARYDVQNGAFGLVMNAKTGEILAMATLGSYDPNNYLEITDERTLVELEDLRILSEAEPDNVAAKKAYQEALHAARLKQWRNRVLSDGYEPGSTFKVLTMAAALDCGAINLNTGFHCSGSEQIPGRSQLLHCWRSQGHGSEQTPQALQNSCNIAFAHIALKLGGEKFFEYIEKFGILEKTGIDLAGESRGIFFDKALVTDTDKWGTASLTSGSFGQTFKITPLQLVRAIASVVNGGNLLEPYIVSEILDADGNTILKQEPTIVRQTISKETSDTMRTLIQSVVEEGTAKNAKVAGFSIGGKTGTSEKIDVFDDTGARVLDKIVSFVGIAPMENPEYIVLVALDTPSRQTGIYISGGVMAAPTVGAVMADILPYLGVERVFSEDDLASKTVTVADMTAMTAAEAEKLLKEQGLTGVFSGTGEAVTGQIPASGASVPGGSQVLLYLGEETPQRTVEVPDFTGMHRQQAADAAGALGLYILVTGNDEIAPNVVVTSQSVPAGHTADVGTMIQLEFTDTGARD